VDKIKSAWEIALEKTSDIKADKKALAEKELLEQGKRLASQYLEDEERYPLMEALAGLPAESRRKAMQGALTTLLANLTLPLSDLTEQRNKLAMKGLLSLASQEKAVAQILRQIDGFFQSFRAERDRLTQMLEQQYKPRLRQKQEALAKQLGAVVELKAEQDPEFVAMLKKNLATFDERYGEALNEAKAELTRLISKEL